jgi:uncharacterized protein (TIGR01244 family)
VLNLRAEGEEGYLPDEGQRAEAAGLKYAHVPVRKEEISDELTTRVLAQIDELPKPLLVHCASGMRAGAMAFMHTATREGLSAEEVISRAQQSGFDCNSEPQLKQFLQHYVETHSQKRND